VGAESAAKEIQSRFPKSPVGFLELGRVYAARARSDAAVAQYDAALRLAPTSAEPVVFAVSTLVGQRRYAEAQQRIEALSVAQPASAIPHELRAEVALAKGDLPAAEESFRKVVAIAPAPASAYRNLASVLVARKNLTGALALLDDAEKAYPKDVMLPTARAQWLTRAGRIDEAIGVYGRVVERAPQADEAANNLAYLLTQVKGDKPSLDRALQLASRFDASTNPAFAGTLGLVRYRLGQYDQAAAVLQRAVALAPNEAVLQLHYGMALYKKGDVQQAKEYLRKAVDSKVLMPNLAEGKSLLAAG
jgi:predicted Zn-dependent protease